MDWDDDETELQALIDQIEEAQLEKYAEADPKPWYIKSLPRPFRSPEFIKERDKWYEVLKQDGFYDIESIPEGKVYHDYLLKETSNRRLHDLLDPSRHDHLHERWWEECSAYLWRGDLRGIDRDIWELWLEAPRYSRVVVWRRLKERMNNKGNPSLYYVRGMIRTTLERIKTWRDPDVERKWEDND